MAGSIDYALGLGTRGFLGPLNLAQGALAAFTGFAVGAGGVLAGVFAQIERGGQLQDLKARTGQNVASLFSLQEGFRIVGLEAGKVPQVIFALQKALSGVNETGETTSDAFLALGLSTEKLRSTDAAKQLTAIAGALARLKPDDAAAIAAKLFPRGLAGDVLQLAGNLGDFEATLGRVAGQAETFRRNAKAFDDIGDTFQALKTTGAGFFTELAAGVTPALQGVLDSLKGFDLEGFGRRIGNAFQAVTAAFKSGQVTELVSLSLAAGFEKAIDFLARSLAAVFSAIPEMIQAGAKGAQGVGLGLLGAISGPLANLLDAGANSKEGFLGISPDSPVGRDMRGFAAITRIIGGLAAEQAGQPIKEAAQKFVEGLQKGRQLFGQAEVGENQKKLKELLDKLIPAVAAPKDGPGVAKPGDVPFVFGKNASAEGVDALTRIGFFSGGGSSGLDLQRRTAVATERTAKAIERIANRDPQGFGNK